MPRPPKDRAEIVPIAQGVARGTRLQEVARQLGVSYSAVQRALDRMRRELAARHADGAVWLDVRERHGIIVAQTWLQLPEESEPAG